jgi:D-arginine dehydrogenase
VIVGAGIAGTAAAWSLAREHGTEVLLLERERQPGLHASGRNASILRTAMNDPLLHALARESAAFYRLPPPGFSSGALLRPTGTFLCATASAADAMAAWTSDPACAMGVSEIPLARLHAAWPQLAPGVARCWLHEQDGVLDVPAILAGFLHGAQAAGAQLRSLTRVLDLVREADGSVRGVRVLAPGSGVPEEINADAVLLAGGAWAAEPAEAAGLALPLKPMRRHIRVTTPLSDIPTDGPVVWIVGDEFYFRPCEGGLLTSACDEDESLPGEGERTAPQVEVQISDKTARWLPAFAGARTARFWAAMRTFAPDHRFVLGPDPRADGLYWAAALGGHGITCGPEAGRIAAAAAAGAAPHPLAAAFLPARLFRDAASAATAPAAASLLG